MERVISYIDGFNLYFGLRSKGWQKYYWLDLVNMSRSLLKPDQSLKDCHYFTARIKSSNYSNQSIAKQNIWLDALKSRPDIVCHFGRYLVQSIKCNYCNSTWMKHEEKMTDVNIATRLIVDAYEDRYDTALIVSGDSDLVPPIQYISEKFPDKRIVVVFPPDRHSKYLKKIAHSYMPLGEDKLRNNLLPDEITGEGGFVLKRPAAWR